MRGTFSLFASKLATFLHGFAILILMTLPPTLAQAHSALLEATPAENAVLDIAPRDIRLKFNQPVSPLAAQLYGPDGLRLDMTDAATAGETVVTTLPAEMLDGTYVFSWRVISEDGHPIAGSQIFSIKIVTGAPVAGVFETDPLIAASLWAARALLYVCMFVGVGGALFASCVAPLPRGAWRTCMALLLTGVADIPLSLALQGLDALGRPFQAISDERVWSTALSTSYGTTLSLLLLALLLAVASLTHVGLPQKLAAGAAAVLTALALASSGHASAATPQWLTRPAVSVHAIALCFWIGSLLPLLLYLRTDNEESRQALSRFSRLIPWAIGPLLVSGVLLASVQLGWPNRQWISPYGALLLSKLLILTCLFALALVNRMRLTGPTLVGDSKVRGQLRVSMRGEIVAVVAVLLVVAGWRFTPPPRVLTELYPDPVSVQLNSPKLNADVTIDPGKPGPVNVLIELNREGVSKTEAVTISLSQPELGIEPFKREAENIGGNRWQVKNLALVASGTWNLGLQVRVSRFEKVDLNGQLELKTRASNDRQPVVVARVGNIQIADPFSRATAPRASVGAGYLVLINTGSVDDRLVSASTPMSDHITPHDMRVENDIMKMRELKTGIAIPAGQTVRLEPGGLHLMLESLKQPIVEGTTIPLTLTFERSGTVTVDFDVLGLAAGGVEDHSSHGG